MKIFLTASVLAVMAMPAIAQAPDMSASYSGQGQYEMDGKMMTANIRGSGKQLRIDMPPEALGTEYGSAMVMNFETGEMISFQTGNVPEEMRFSMVLNSAPLPMANEYAMKSGGSAVIAGERCQDYTYTEQTETGQIVDYTSCVTKDGIMLRSLDGAGNQVFLMTELRRGPQSPSLFSAPPGYRELSPDSIMGMSGFGMGAEGMGDMDMMGEGYGQMPGQSMPGQPMPGMYPEEDDRGFVEQQTEEAAESTKREIGNRVDQERRKVVDDVLGSIFGN